ncbi:MAG: glycoside hydrolase family 55 protein [Akkermansiaceae bacterium]|nr:glycoside hydrolase family 55 protein [Akkermansiaceae bacterium]MCF7730555.1 glycoside hydrolase family 55 protein [Akkermansiaceae bacterium]
MSAFSLAAISLCLPLSLAAADVAFPADPSIVNVRELGAKGDGTTDDTEAIRKGVAWAAEKHYRTVYLPVGTYRVSGTIEWKNFAVLQGQDSRRTVVRLDDRCVGYGDPAKPKPVVRCLYNNNESIGNYIADLTIDTGRGNPGAIALRYNCHNTGTCERVRLRSGDGAGVVGLDLSETEFGPARVRDLWVDGFDVGVRTPGQPSSAVLERIRISNQRVAGIENRFPLSLRGLVSDNKVPAIVQRDGCLSHLVLLDADLRGGAKANAAILADSQVYLRNVRCGGYGSLLRGMAGKLPGPVIREFVGGRTELVDGAPVASLCLPVEDAPAIPREPPATWRLVDDSAEDDTAAIQTAIDSGATTVCFRSHGAYRISDTIRIRGAVRRIIGLREVTISGDAQVFKPGGRVMVRFEEGAGPVVWESLGLGAWPHEVWAMEMACRRPVELLGFGSVAGCVITTAPTARGGRLFIDEFCNNLILTVPMRVFIRQCNTENNPFDLKNPRLPHTYIVNEAADLWVFGMKTEAPAEHVFTGSHGRTEILGGFFRDHFGAGEYGQQVPYFRTAPGGSLSAIYAQYAHAPGKARALQAIAGERRFVVEPGNFLMGLYRTGR